MTMQAAAEVIPMEKGYNYAQLDLGVAQALRVTTARIKDRIKRTLENIVAMGQDLLEVEKALPYGEFGRWLQAEFAWTRRTADNFKVVASWLKASCEIISQLRMSPTAAYLLAAASTPDSARHEALDRAKAGERITPQVAREIVEWARSADRCDSGSLPGYRLRHRLARILERYRQLWEEGGLTELVVQLREFADALEGSNVESRTDREQEKA